MCLEKSDISARAQSNILTKSPSPYPHNGAKGYICQSPEKLNLFDMPKQAQNAEHKFRFCKRS